MGNRITIFFLFIWVIDLNAQLDYHENLTMDDGLSNQTVYSVLQDSDGFIWMGTEDGLCKYDGYSFTIYRHDSNDTLSLSSNFIRTLYEDHKGVLWVGTTYGLNRYDKFQGTFRRFNFKDDGKSLENGTIQCLTETKDGSLWIGTDGGGLSKFDRDSETFKTYRSPKDGLGQDYVYALSAAEDGSLWIGLGGYGLDHFDPESERFENFKFKQANETDAFRANIIVNIYQDDGALVLGTLNGLIRFNTITKTFEEHYSYANSTFTGKDVVKIFRRQHVFWVLSSAGLFEWDTHKTGQPFTKIMEQGFPFDNGSYVYDIMIDTQGNTWMGTVNAGVFKFPATNPIFSRHQSDVVVRSFCELSSGRLLVSTSNGLFINDDKPVAVPVGNTFLIVKTFEDRDKNVWLATSGSGLIKLDSALNVSKRFVYSGSDLESINYNVIEDIEQDELGFIWVATTAGFARLNPATNTFKRYNKENVPLYDQYVNDIWVEDKNTIWLGTSYGGLNKFNVNDGTLQYFYNDPSKPNTLVNNHVYHIAPLNNQTLLVSTKGGLHFVDKNGVVSKVLNSESGLLNDIVYGTLVEEENVWISTNYGLSRFNTRDSTVTNYTKSDGLIDNSFKAKSFLKASNGNLYFGSEHGILTVDPQHSSESRDPTSVMLTDLRIFHEPVSTRKGNYNVDKHINFLDSIQLEHDDNTLSIRFSAMDYVNPGKVNYEYRLSGFSESWVKTDAGNRIATYTNLEPGAYLFEVKASNGEGSWSKESTRLFISIKVPPWKTWWAYGLYLFSFVLISYVIVRAFIVRERLKSNLRLEHVEVQKMQQLDRLKSSFFTGLSHEFRTPLALITAPLAELSSKYKSDKDTVWILQLIQRNADRLLSLINQLLDLSKLEAGKLKLEVTKKDIVSWAKLIIAPFESLAMSREVSFDVEFPQTQCETYFDEIKLEQILLNLLSNAFKYTSSNGEVKFSMRVLTDVVGFEVRNTGQQIPDHEKDLIFDRFYQSEHVNKAEGSGIGLALVKEFAELHHGSVRVYDDHEWTVFKVALSLNDESYSADEKVKSRAEAASEQVRRQRGKGAKIPSDTFAPDRPLVLVVEDNDDLRNYIVHQLQGEFDVESAKNGVEGARLAQNIPDLMITDFMMPEMDGMELLELLRADAKTSHVPVIMLTAKAEKESRIQGIAGGADHYLSKPFDTEELLTCVRSLLLQRSRIKDHYHKEFLIAPKAEEIVSADDKFLQHAIEILEKELDNHELSVDRFAKELAMSRVQLHRKMKAVIGCSASEFIRQYRLKKANEYLKVGKGTVSEIAYSVGFNNLSYFTKAFKEVYKINPSKVHEMS